MSNQQNKKIGGMVDVSGKDITRRVACASAEIRMSVKAFRLLMTSGSPKGDVFETARVAGVMAAKATPSIVPLCHPLELGQVKIAFIAQKKDQSIVITSEVVCWGRTGIEMEALTAVAAAALTIYDMMKWAGQDMTIGDIKLLHKSGGKSGVWNRAE